MSVIFIIGCGEGTDPLLSSSQRDIDNPPAKPIWTEMPIDVEQIWGERYKVTIRWKTVTTDEMTIKKTNIAGYKVFKYNNKEKLVDTFITQIKSNSNEQFFVDTNTDLVKGTEFSYSVVTFDTYMVESKKSAPQLVKITGEILKRLMSPQNFHWVHGKNEATIYWDPVTAYEDGTSISTDLYGYEIYRNDNNEAPEIPLAILNPQQTSFTDKFIQYNRNYTYWIRAIGKLGNKSPISNSISLLLNEPDKPQNEDEYSNAIDSPNPPHISSVKSETDSIGNSNWTITWNMPLFNSDGTSYTDHHYYKIYRSNTSPGIFTLLGIATNTSYTYKDTVSSNYYYKITAVDMYENESKLSNLGYIGVNDPTTNNADLNFRVDNHASTIASVILKWNDIYTVTTDALSYNIYRSFKTDGPYFQIGSIEDEGIDLVYTDAEIIPGVVYYYRITIVNATGESEFSYYSKGAARNARIIFEAENGTLITSQTSPAVNDTVGSTSNVFFKSIPGANYSNNWAVSYIPGNISESGNMTSHHYTIALSSIPSGNYDITMYFEYSKFRGNYKAFLYGEDGFGELEATEITSMYINGYNPEMKFTIEAQFTNEAQFTKEVSVINCTYSDIELDEEENYYLKVYYDNGGNNGFTVECEDGELQRLVLDKIIFAGK